jgi:hypothetical protein
MLLLFFFSFQHFHVTLMAINPNMVNLDKENIEFGYLMKKL